MSIPNKNWDTNQDLHQGLSAVICGLLLRKLNEKSKGTHKHTHACDIPWGNATPSQCSNKCSKSGSVKSGLQTHFQLTTYYPIAFHPYFHKGPCYTFPSDLPHCSKCPWKKMSVLCLSLSLAAWRWKMSFVNKNPRCCNFKPLGQNRGWQA